MDYIFPHQLQKEPDQSQIYTSDFDGQGTYKAAQTQGSAFYEEGLKDFHCTISNLMIAQALGAW